MRSSLPVGILTLLMHLTVSAQHYSFRHVPPRLVAPSITYVGFNNGIGWTVHDGTVAYWLNAEQQSSIDLREAHVSSADVTPSGNLWLLNNLNDVTYITTDGEEVVQPRLYTLTFPHAMVAIDDDSCYIARPQYGRQEV